MTFDIPILASYRIPITKKSHIQINAGPVMSLGLSSTLDLSGRTNSESLRHYKIVNGKLTNELYDNNTYKNHINHTGP